MNQYLNNLLARQTESQNKVQPRGRSRFEPAPWGNNDPGFHVPVTDEAVHLSEENNEEVASTAPIRKAILVPNLNYETTENSTNPDDPANSDVRTNARQQYSVAPGLKNTILPLSEKNGQGMSSTSLDAAKDFVTMREAIQRQSIPTTGIIAPVDAFPQSEFVKPAIPDVPENLSMRRPSGAYPSNEMLNDVHENPSAGPTTIQIKIDRIEVRAVKKHELTPKKKREIPLPNLSLDDYLKKQGK